MRHRVAVLPAVVLFLAGCAHTTQLTSGSEYIDRYPDPPLSMAQQYTPDRDVDREVLETANVEPMLRFPARIGLVRIEQGEIANVPAGEVAAWRGCAARLGETFGEFVPVSPLIAGMVYPSESPQRPESAAMQTDELIRKIRLGAARQHLDIVLIYEVFSRTKRMPLFSSVANLTIIGMYFVPSEKLTTVGHANALLIDVRNGYPYGTASASLEDSDVYAFAEHWEKVKSLEERTRIAAAVNLVPEVEAMMRELRDKTGTQPPE